MTNQTPPEPVLPDSEGIGDPDSMGLSDGGQCRTRRRTPSQTHRPTELAALYPAANEENTLVRPLLYDAQTGISADHHSAGNRQTELDLLAAFYDPSRRQREHEVDRVFRQPLAQFAKQLERLQAQLGQKEYGYDTRLFSTRAAARDSYRLLLDTIYSLGPSPARPNGDVI